MNKLIPVELQNQRVLTTQQLAEAYETDANNVKNNFNNHKDKFIGGIHYFFLQGDDLRDFRLQVSDTDLQISSMTRSLYLWTERGANRHCKILDTDKAWEQFDYLEDTYFTVKQQQASFSELSPQLQLLISIETKQKAQDIAIADTNKKLDCIGDIISLNNNAWRTESKDMIVKIAVAMGGMEFIKEVNTMIYDLLNSRFGVNVERRLLNTRRRMADEGVCKSKRDRLTKVDIIAEDKKLIEGYIVIIKELAVKYGTWK